MRIFGAWREPNVVRNHAPRKDLISNNLPQRKLFLIKPRSGCTFCTDIASMDAKSPVSKARLRAHRDAAGLTHEQLAELVTQNVEFVLALENGEKQVTADELWDLCQALDVQPHALIDQG